jgi:hypothetical protein
MVSHRAGIVWHRLIRVNADELETIVSKLPNVIHQPVIGTIHINAQHSQSTGRSVALSFKMDTNESLEV